MSAGATLYRPLPPCPQVSVTASDVADKVTSTVGQGFDRVATWWEAQRAERDAAARQQAPRNVMV